MLHYLSHIYIYIVLNSAQEINSLVAQGVWRKLGKETTLGLFWHQRPGRESQRVMAEGGGECQQRPPIQPQHRQVILTRRSRNTWSLNCLMELWSLKHRFLSYAHSAQQLLGAPGPTTSSILATRNKKLITTWLGPNLQMFLPRSQNCPKSPSRRHRSQSSIRPKCRLSMDSTQEVVSFSRSAASFRIRIKNTIISTEGTQNHGDMSGEVNHGGSLRSKHFLDLTPLW